VSSFHEPDDPIASGTEAARPVDWIAAVPLSWGPWGPLDR
jgi:hypothetical protein